MNSQNNLLYYSLSLFLVCSIAYFISSVGNYFFKTTPNLYSFDKKLHSFYSFDFDSIDYEKPIVKKTINRPVKKVKKEIKKIIPKLNINDFFVLNGIIKSNNKEFALLEGVNTRKTYISYIGETVEGFVIKSFNPVLKFIVLTKNNVDYKLYFKDEKDNVSTNLILEENTNVETKPTIEKPNEVEVIGFENQKQTIKNNVNAKVEKEPYVYYKPPTNKAAVTKTKDYVYLDKNVVSKYASDLSMILNDIKFKSVNEEGRLKGYEITYIRHNSPISFSGLKRGDLVISINNVSANDKSAFFDLLRRSDTIFKYDVVVIRDKSQLNIKFRIR